MAGWDNAHHAWSDETGEWRKVRISYWSLPFRSRHPVWIIVTGVIQLVLAGAVMRWASRSARIDTFAGTDIGRTLSLMYTVFGVIAGLFMLYGVVKIVVGMIGASRTQTVVGTVLRTRGVGDGLARFVTLAEWIGSLAHRFHLDAVLRARRRHDEGFVAIDDGSDDHVRAFWADDSSFGELHQGARVRVEVRPLLRSIVDVDVDGDVTGPPTAAPNDPSR